MASDRNSLIALTRFLLLPPRAWCLMLGTLIALILAVCAFFEWQGSEGAFFKALQVLAGSSILAVLVLPFRLRVLLSSRVFLLAGSSLRQLLSIQAAALAVWALVVAPLLSEQLSSLSFNLSLVFWALASVGTVLPVIYPKIFIFGGWVIFFLAASEPGKRAIEHLYATLPLWSFGLMALPVGILAWGWLYRVSLVAQIGTINFSGKNQWGRGGGPAFTLFSRVKLSGSERQRFLKTTMMSNRPMLTIFLLACAGVAASFFILALLNRWKEPTLDDWVAVESFRSSISYLFCMSTFFVVGMAMNFARRFRSVWLLLPGDRLTLIKHIEWCQYRVVPLAMAPVALVYLVVGFLGGIALGKVAEIVLVSVVLAFFASYWFLYIYGIDSVWSGIGSLLLIAVFALYYAVAASAKFGHAMIWTGLGAAIILTVILRHRVYGRWSKIDLTQMRINWPL